jgi:hypothetical protein
MLENYMFTSPLDMVYVGEVSAFCLSVVCCALARMECAQNVCLECAEYRADGLFSGTPQDRYLPR